MKENKKLKTTENRKLHKEDSQSDSDNDRITEVIDYKRSNGKNDRKRRQTEMHEERQKKIGKSNRNKDKLNKYKDQQKEIQKKCRRHTERTAKLKKCQTERRE